jgi:hypothetical protein
LHLIYAKIAVEGKSENETNEACSVEVCGVDEREFEEMMRERMRALGSAGGKKRAETLSEDQRKKIACKAGKASAKARRRNLTPEQRFEMARKAGLAGAAARWGDHKPAGKTVPVLDPEAARARRREIARAAAKARRAKAGETTSGRGNT